MPQYNLFASAYLPDFLKLKEDEPEMYKKILEQPDLVVRKDTETGISERIDYLFMKENYSGMDDRLMYAAPLYEAGWDHNVIAFLLSRFQEDNQDLELCKKTTHYNDLITRYEKMLTEGMIDEEYKGQLHERSRNHPDMKFYEQKRNDAEESNNIHELRYAEAGIEVTRDLEQMILTRVITEDERVRMQDELDIFKVKRHELFGALRKIPDYMRKVLNY